MDTTGQEVGKIETRLRQFGTKLDKLEANAGEAVNEAKIDYRKQIDNIKDKRAVVQSKLNAFKAANGGRAPSGEAEIRIGMMLAHAKNRGIAA